MMTTGLPHNSIAKATETRPGPLWLSDREARSLLTVPAAIETVAEALRAGATGDAISLSKSAVDLPGGGVLQSLGAAIGERDLAGAKTWVSTTRGAAPVILLWRITDGALCAVVEATSLGRLRTGALAGVATDCLADPSARSFALIGTGRQAMAQVEAMCAVRPIDTVRICSRNVVRRDAFAEQVRAMFDGRVVCTDSVRDAVDSAQIITLITNSVDPVLTTAMVAAGTHVNAVGAIRAGSREFDPRLLERCTSVAVDDLPSAKQFAQELIDHASQPGREDWAWVTPLGSLSAVPVAHQLDTRRQDITLYKGVGSGLADVAVAGACWQEATQIGVGRLLT